MKKLMACFAAVLGFAACSYRPAISQNDIDSWIGTSVDELDSQPEFAAMTFSEKKLSNGASLRQYTTCVLVEGESRTGCFSSQFGTFCKGGGMPAHNSCCVHTFSVKHDRVFNYTPVGSCHLGCSRRPSSHLCQTDED